jgi:hypothetical protein
MAVAGLALSTHEMPERLANVYLLYLRAVTIKEVPEELREDFEALHAEFARMAPGGRVGSVLEAGARLSEAVARDHVRRVLGMFERACRRSEGSAGG